MTEQISNAVLSEKIGSLGDKLDMITAQNNKDHSTIIEQTTRTNGRVTRLEKIKNMLVGGLVFINIVVVPIFLAVIIQYLQKQ